MTGWDVTAVVLLGAAGFIFSYDSLRQIAVAIHARASLSYLFPVFVDGFIAYGVRAIVVLRNRPFGARLYAWTLFLLATGASLWANSLHAITLNRNAASGPSALRLGDSVVGVLSMLAPLALAGAVHLYILMTRTHGTVLSSPPSVRPGPVPDGDGIPAVSLEKVARISSSSGRHQATNELPGVAVTASHDASRESADGPGPSVAPAAEAKPAHPADSETELSVAKSHDPDPVPDQEVEDGTTKDRPSTVRDGKRGADNEDDGIGAHNAPLPQAADAEESSVSDVWRRSPRIPSDELRQMLPLAREAVKHGRITRDEVAAAVRAQYRISNDRLSELLAILRKEAEDQAHEPSVEPRPLW
ncbi:DUF2637 domain-containing protein [Streptomyces sp. NPDC048442]|uniref:DUF2637 domain-containing protein n=1 Tax=Streptomyces sp. NPDC048442 TaxID=3154823 RepID=UPI0034218641